MKKPVIGIPMGDPAGIGPEIVIKALMDESVFDICKPIVIGDASVLGQIRDIIDARVEIRPVGCADEAEGVPGTIEVIDLANMDTGKLIFGRVDALAGKAAYEYIEKAANMAMAGEIDAVATTPINKESIKAANIDFIGHTEMFAYLSGTIDPLTMFQVMNMRVFFLSRHLSLRAACDAVKKDKIKEYIARCLEALVRLGVNNPLLAVAGLNPHNGEHGMFGNEEVNEISPAVDECTEEGMNVTGPVPGDSVFALALKGKYDGVLSMYHDQGHIATKTVDFERTISLTIGMPYLRTSVDHGTAFDIAGKGIASGVSMYEAIRLAALYAPRYGRE
ncbi:MAG TPA: 4-hydroxythreonine-4-phosphate dehydrogenase PdxA [Clostridia bacterium]|nr:4-hydroxythreonine-4-phosphate dehydrogenase PdxA [Clostridia bacterium]HRX42217.1 4-hydroxythreonine-4-phosphate dehydrogenase PdxA [Clostridia bacterium]